MGKRYFGRDVFDFLDELAANNNREWWEANKDRYVTTIREPALDFIEDFGRSLQSISPHFVGDPRTNGGSLMRPYRDMRFVKDGAPYKTNVGIHFRHLRAKDVHAPGFYVHIEPGQNFLGVGMWTPRPAVAQTIRAAINDRPSEWRRAAHSEAFTGTWELGEHEEDYLKRVPKDFDPDHPFPDDLRLKSFTAGTRVTKKLLTSSGLDADLLAMFGTAKLYTKFLCEAIDVPF